MYDFYSTSGYSISPENYLISASESLVVHSSVDHYWPFFGSDDLLSVAASVITDAASIETNPNQINLPRRRINRQSDQAKNNGVDAGDGDDDDASADTMKAKIASHPSYSKLLDAYIDCQKVGASPEVACLLDDIRHENDDRKRNATASTCLGVDPELDEFMETFYHLLVKYKSDLARPFDEATVFLGNIETQLRNLDIGGISSSEEEVTSRISSLKREFTKTKKKGKLPKEARRTLLDWWNSHYNWPYPTEGDKISLVETTGLDPKQVNNWFINQRKRHWNPSESMQLAIMGSLPVPGHYIYDD
ncbi:hypothetical protein L1987_62087 [Smallanthus sonchifolius]|uniref:Uncharacterized protein n=1 Tax=Smallanthus sonchifolius TaxID=185202 RepID=A0ACB9C9D8_9ASTR|nr:hypothetical protein L1987_62087 [Smallanthus sonchifolius]